MGFALKAALGVALKVVLRTALNATLKSCFEGIALILPNFI
jgi:hypothetical protein